MSHGGLIKPGCDVCVWVVFPPEHRVGCVDHKVEALRDEVQLASSQAIRLPGTWCIMNYDHVNETCLSPILDRLLVSRVSTIFRSNLIDPLDQLGASLMLNPTPGGFQQKSHISQWERADQGVSASGWWRRLQTCQVEYRKGGLVQNTTQDRTAGSWASVFVSRVSVSSRLCRIATVDPLWQAAVAWSHLLDKIGQRVPSEDYTVKENWLKLSSCLWCLRYLVFGHLNRHTALRQVQQIQIMVQEKENPNVPTCS